MVVCRFMNDDHDYDDHAFCLKQAKQGGWVLLDSALIKPLYTHPMSTDETWFDQLKFFERATELVVYTLALEDLITLESDYPTFCRIKAGRDVDYSF